MTGIRSRSTTNSRREMRIARSYVYDVARYHVSALWLDASAAKPQHLIATLSVGVVSLPDMDYLTPKERSARMALVKARDTHPERRVRSFLHARGFRFGLHHCALPGKPDIVLTKYRTIVFVHGCFWHACPHCKKGSRMPATNTRFWADKIAKNVERDSRSKHLNELGGWRVLVVWECETKRDATLEKALRSLLVTIGR